MKGKNIICKCNMKLRNEKLWVVLVYLVFIQTALKETNVNHTKSLHLHLFGFHFLDNIDDFQRSCPIDRMYESEITICIFFSVIKGRVCTILAAGKFYS
jgi:hypothetical protein